MKGLLFGILGVLIALNSWAQITFPVNGVVKNFEPVHVFTNANIVVSPYETIKKGRLVIQGQHIISVDNDTTIPEGAIVHNLNGNFIYPSFIDLHSDYGMPKLEKTSWKPQPQYLSNNKSAAGWNEAIHPEVNANESFSHFEKIADEYRGAGFGVVLSHVKDGIARGSGVLTTLANDVENNTILIGKASAHYSLEKGRSKQKFPGSLMGTLALIKQTYLDAEWYDQGSVLEYNRSLESWNNLQEYPQFFEVKDKLDIGRIYQIANEFEIDYIVVGNGDEYQRVDELVKSGFAAIIPLNFPKAYDVSKPDDADMVSLKQMKHWELAPSNPSILIENDVFIAFTSNKLKNKSEFLENVKSAIRNGLSKSDALAALTINPADLIEANEFIGTLEKGKIANFLITSEDLFENGEIVSNWIQGKKYDIKKDVFKDLRGTYIVDQKDTMIISGSLKKYNVRLLVDTLEYKLKATQDEKYLNLTYEIEEGVIRIASFYNQEHLKGIFVSKEGVTSNWSAKRVLIDEEEKEKEKAITSESGSLWFPNMAYGWEKTPKAESIIFRNATIWTNEDAGILENADLAISDGKIIALGVNLDTLDIFGKNNFKEIDAKDYHISAGIIDEHSHIAISRGVNEGSQASSAEVSIADVINSDDINIYRQLSGGVTTAQLLHGSANPIGGQSGLIKFRWGHSPEKMKFENADGFIKFALGENVKQSNWGEYESIRFPQTRMGVEQVFYDHFMRAKAYQKEWEAYNQLSTSDKRKTIAPREDLEMNTLVEILNHERFITCHSYVQSEINMLMHVADSMGFTLNTFTHILEGYKVADKMQKHGAGASTFSDWWAYKFEVNDAIPYNAALLAEMGVLTAINSDDAEMARRLNQEAAKAVKYGGASQEEALKMVTLNPAKLLHIDDRVGSIKKGKDADIVLWTDNPLSVYAQVQQTYVDGVCYFDQTKDLELRKRNEAERNRLIQKMLTEKSNGKATQRAKKEMQVLYHCDTMEGHEHQGHSH